MFNADNGTGSGGGAGAGESSGSGISGTGTGGESQGGQGGYNGNSDISSPGEGQGGNTGQDGQGSEKLFTQAQLDAIIKDRVHRESLKYKDYEDLKAKAAKLADLEKAQMTEQERIQAELREAQEKLTKLQAEAENVRIENLKLKVLDEFGLAKSWLTRIGGTTEEEIRNDAQGLKKMLDSMKANTTTIGGGSNPGEGHGGSGKIYTRAELETLPPEVINANWNIIQEQLRKGLIK